MFPYSYLLAACACSTQPSGCAVRATSAAAEERSSLRYGLSRRSMTNYDLHWKHRHARAATHGNGRNMLVNMLAAVRAAVNALKARAARARQRM